MLLSEEVSFFACSSAGYWIAARRSQWQEGGLITDPVIIININKTYKRGSGIKGIYDVTRNCWVIGETRRKGKEAVEYALSEYKGLIVEVFEITDWFTVATKDKNGNDKTRWAFNEKIADKTIRDKYINKSVADAKQKGASNPIRYKL